MLQDDSGNFQHFAGTMSADGGRVAFRQTDPGGAGNGILLRTTYGCSVSSMAGTFNVTASGRTVDVNTGVDSGRVSVRGVLIADGARNLYFDSGPDEPALAAGTYEVAGRLLREASHGVAGGRAQNCRDALPGAF